MEIIKWDTVTQSSMTPVAFLEQCLEDISKEEMVRIIQSGGFQLDGQVIKDPNGVLEFKVGDTVLFYQDIFKDNKTCLQFTIVSTQ